MAKHKIRSIPNIDRTLHYRTSAIPSTFDVESRSVQVIAATEQPTSMPDWERKEMVDEVLLMSGVEMPPSKQVPLLDSHQRYESENVIGSAKDIKTEGPQMLARAEFSSAADGIYTRVKEGHLTDISIGYKVLDKTFVPKGKTQTINGRSFRGPVNVVTRWKLREVSVTPIGADEQAKIRGLAGNPFNQEVFSMTDQLRAACVAAGMPADHSDEQAQTWLAENIGKIGQRTEPAKGTDPAAVAKLIADELDKREAAKTAKRAELKSQIEKACEKRGLQAHADEIFRSSDSIEDAHERMLDIMAAGPTVSPFFQVGPAEADKHRDALTVGVMSRAFAGASELGQKSFDKEYPNDKRPAGWDRFRYRTMKEIVRECVALDGFRGAEDLDPVRLMEAALLGGHRVGLTQSRSASYGYHNTGMFPQLMADVTNKVLQKSYDEAETTWQRCFRQAPSVADFKTKKVIRISDAPYLDQWDGKSPPRDIAFTDEQESYAVEAHHNKASFDYKCLVNDDMDGLSRIPAKLGATAKRTVNAAAWAQLTSNPTLQDSQPLFLASATGLRFKANRTTSGAAAPSNASLNTGRALMRRQVGPNNAEATAAVSILNIYPKYLIVPAALENTGWTLINSSADPAASGNSGVANYSRTLELIVEPLLDSNSTTIWYLACDPSMCDTVEVTFLQGQETPQTRFGTDIETLAMSYYILQSFAAKAIDFRGLYQNDGT